MCNQGINHWNFMGAFVAACKLPDLNNDERAVKAVIGHFEAIKDGRHGMPKEFAFRVVVNNLKPVCEREGFSESRWQTPILEAAKRLQIDFIFTA